MKNENLILDEFMDIPLPKDVEFPDESSGNEIRGTFGTFNINDRPQPNTDFKHSKSSSDLCT